MPATDTHRTARKRSSPRTEPAPVGARPKKQPSAKLPEKSSRAKEVFQRLKKLHPDATIELDFSNPLELLVATILSAQCTDAKVNQVTATLFKKYRKPTDYLSRPAVELEAAIRQTGFFKQKAKHIRGAMQAIIDEHRGSIPQSMEALVKLPGVGRKTANVVLGNAFGIPGLPVDTHVRRVSQRLALTRHEDPVKIESDLAELLAPRDWTLFSHTLIFHGRRICKARKPLCERCTVRDLCAYYADHPLPQDREGGADT